MHFTTKFASKVLATGALVLILALPMLTINAASNENSGLDVDDAAGSSPPAVKGRSYIVLMDLSPAVSFEGDLDGFKATKSSKGEKFDPRSTAAKAYASYSLARQDAVLARAGVAQTAVTNRYTAVLNGFSAVMSEAQAEAVARQTGVATVMNDGWRQPMTDSSPDFLGLTGPNGAWAAGYTGKGVYVGVIDTGIWPEHPSFADDGSYIPHGLTLENSAANPACNFGNTAHNAQDIPFSCNNKLVAARQMLATYRTVIGAEPGEYDSARDDDGHGTHTASTAAGNRDVAAALYGINRGTVSGIAPDAYVLAYKGLGVYGGFTSDLAAAIEQAVLDGVDVINYSVGGSANLPGADELAFLYAADAGVHVATSAGNSGPVPGSLGNPGTMPWLTTVGASTQSRFFEGQVVLGDGASYSGASITPGTSEKALVDAAGAGGDMCKPGTLQAGQVAGKIVLCRRGSVDRVDKSLAVYQAGGAGMIMYNNSDKDNLYSDTHWVPSVHVDNTSGMAIKAYIAGQPFGNNAYMPTLIGGSGQESEGNPPADSPTAKIIGQLLATLDYAPSMAYFSSRGPNPVSPDLIKPDVTAPGVHILAGNTPAPISGVPGELFQAIAGTSMSSPHVAGLLALIDQAHPGWSPAQAKSALMTTAYRDVVDSDRVSTADPFDRGAGHVDPRDAARAGSLFQPGLTYDAGLVDYEAYICGANFGIFPPLYCALLDAPSEAYNLNVPSIGISQVVGSQTVARSVTSVAAGAIEYTAVVEVPEGSNVTVSPNSFTINEGGVQAFELTITHEDAPIDEWHFGSLTWQSAEGPYAVYSPIAVRAAPAGIP